MIYNQNLNFKLIILLIIYSFVSCKNNEIDKNEIKSPPKELQIFSIVEMDSIFKDSIRLGKLTVKYDSITDDSRNVVYQKKDYNYQFIGKEIKYNNIFIKNGWWSLLKKNERFIDIEYLTIGDTIQKINQYKMYLDSGIVNLNASRFYSIDLPDTIQLNKEYKFNIFLNDRAIGEEDIYLSFLTLSDDIDVNFKTFWKVKNTYLIEEVSRNKWKAKKVFNTKGLNTIKGYIYVQDEEHKNVDEKYIDIEDYSRIFYISKEIFVQ